MIKLRLFFLLAAISFSGFSQNNGFSLVEYMPAPGQHINMENIGTPYAALCMSLDFDKLISLGSFGGSVTLRFDRACENHPDNPYGVDFTIFGNAFSGSSEPGVVWVMQDENQNRMPDETWYEIAGSNYYQSRTKHNYSVTYFKTETRDILWKDNFGKSGVLKANSFNLQEYYPESFLFPEYSRDSVTFSGTWLEAFVDSSLQNEIRTRAFAFGYADNFPRVKGIDLWLPDNPYTSEKEGAGGDPIDISWAVDSLGNYIHLDSVHFVKIVSGTLANTGRLGEISTDVAWITDVKTASGISGKNNLLVVYQLPESLVAGDSIQLEAVYFEKGKRIDADYHFHSSNDMIAAVDENGKLIARAKGKTEIVVSARDAMKTVPLHVVVPDSISLLTEFSALYPGDSILLTTTVFDNEGSRLNIPVSFSSSNPSVGTIVQNGGHYFFRAMQSGETNLVCHVNGFPLTKELRIKVLSAEDKVSVYFSLKEEGQNLFPFQWIEVAVTDLNRVVEDRQHDYSNMEHLTLFHAMTDGLIQSGLEFQFRDDEDSNGSVYLHSVMKDGFNIRGWGGRIDPSAYAQAWIARLNSRQYLNNFDNVSISSGDTLDVYHISDITGSWEYSRLLSGKDSARMGDEVELFLEQTTCWMTNHEISESEFLPISNQEVFGNKHFFTDENGRVRVMLESEPPVSFHSGENAVLISKKLVTGIKRNSMPEWKVYPIPATDEITLDGIVLSDVRVVVRDMNGTELFVKRGVSGFFQIDISFLAPGMYWLIIESNRKTETHKIIKK